MNKRVFWTILTLFLSLSELEAQMLGANMGDPGAAETPRNYGFNVSTTFDSNFFSLSDEVNSSVTNITAFSGNYRFKNGLMAIAGISAIKDLSGEREENLNDGSFTLFKRLYSFSKNLHLNGSTNLFLPFSERSRISQSLEYAVQASPSLIYSASSLIPGLTLILQPAFRVNSHKFTTQTNGNSNVRYSLRNSFRVMYAMNNKFFLGLNNSYTRLWKYGGNSTDLFSFDQNITYMLTNAFSLTLGHSIGGSALAVNGRDSNVKLFSSDESSYYLSLGYMY